MRQNTISVRRENRTLENFKSFISEEKHENYRVVVISNELGDKAITAKRMEEEANKLEYPYYIVPMDGTYTCLLYTSPSPRDLSTSRMPSSA